MFRRLKSPPPTAAANWNGHFRAEVIGAASATPSQRRAAEAAVEDSLMKALGSSALVRNAYAAWLDADAASAHDGDVAKARWESAFANATYLAGAELPAADFRAFFVIHLA
ncbi:hypothetical protein [Ramlibacter albus]|uniref:Uncharacterized protein n=1 Tax=Ramlibacter albus TaxID=2079448 RepID=A0A923M5E3_9BURK|nr:hypothetical protein [Ramlibacter albus]MBC5763076.1 hypothetical protein [Ramlibacter albus]